MSNRKGKPEKLSAYSLVASFSLLFDDLMMAPVDFVTGSFHQHLHIIHVKIVILTGPICEEHQSDEFMARRAVICMCAAE